MPGNYGPKRAAPYTGTRRVNEAQRWLEKRNFVTIEARPGHANRVTVLEETGTGTPTPRPAECAMHPALERILQETGFTARVIPEREDNGGGIRVTGWRGPGSMDAAAER